MSTYKTMSVSDLGDSCDASDLAIFVEACKRRQARTGESDITVTRVVYRKGDWLTGARRELSKSKNKRKC